MSRSRFAARSAAMLLLLVLLAGCGIFRSKDELKPAKLVAYERSLDVRRAWVADLGKGAKLPLAGLRPAIAGGVVYAASADGRVHALELETGRARWSVDLDLPLGAGPGVGSDVVVLGGLDGEVIAIDQVTGAELWRAEVSSEVLAPPAAADGIVVVRSQDGRVFGLAAGSGRREWVYDQSVPLLSLRGTGAPIALAGFVYIGFDNGRVAALRLRDGSVVWEQAVATPEGRTELERIVDIDGTMVLVASDLYVVSYQGLLAALTAQAGRILWVKDMSSARGLTVHRTLLAVSAADDAVVGVDRLSGGTLWRQDALVRRSVSGPAFHGDAIVVGDFEGYLHWISEEDGRFIARERAGNDPIVASPVTVADLLLVQSQDGRLYAFQLPR